MESIDPVPSLQARIKLLEGKIHAIRTSQVDLIYETEAEIRKKEHEAATTRKELFMWQGRANQFEMLLRNISSNAMKAVLIHPIAEAAQADDAEDFTAKRPRRAEAIRGFEERFEDFANEMRCKILHGSEGE